MVVKGGTDFYGNGKAPMLPAKKKRDVSAPSRLGIFILFHVLPDKALNVALHIALTKKIFE